jgi:hypothetical protein
MRLKVRSLVGPLPLCATTVIPGEAVERLPGLVTRARQMMRRHPELLANIADPEKPGVAGRRLLAVMNETKLRRVLTRVLDEERGS